MIEIGIDWVFIFIFIKAESLRATVHHAAKGTKGIAPGSVAEYAPEKKTGAGGHRSKNADKRAENVFFRGAAAEKHNPRRGPVCGRHRERSFGKGHVFRMGRFPAPARALDAEVVPWHRRFP